MFRIIKILIPVILILNIQFACKNNSDEELKVLAIETVAEKLNVESDYISISEWLKVECTKGDVYVASFLNSEMYTRKKDPVSREYIFEYLGLFEVTKSGNINLISLNPNILNKRDHSTDVKQIYKITPNFRYSPGFSLSNGETNYNFIVRLDERELMFDMGFNRKLASSKEMVIREYKDDSYHSISFEKFKDYTLPYISNERDVNTITIPTILNNNEEFFLIFPNYDTEEFNTSLRHYGGGQKKSQMTLTDMELAESSYNHVKFKFKAIDESKREKTVYITQESSFKSELDEKKKYPITIIIQDDEDKEGRNSSHKVSDELDGIWNKTTIADTRKTMITSYYLPEDAEVINTYETNFNDDDYPDYFVSAIYEGEKGKQSGIFLFKGNKDHDIDYIGIESLDQLLIAQNSKTKDEYISVNWENPLLNREGYILTINKIIPKENKTESESFLIELNRNDKMYMTESWKTNHVDSYMEINFRTYSQAYVFADYLNPKSKLKTDSELSEKIITDASGNWFLKAILSDQSSLDKKSVITKAIYNPSVDLTFEKDYFSIIDSIYAWNAHDAYKLFKYFEEDSESGEESIWDYNVSNYWAAHFLFHNKNYYFASEYINRYFENKNNEDISLKQDALQLKQNIQNNISDEDVEYEE